MSSILSNLRPAKNSRRKMKRIGRGQGSGHGGTATRGHKGAKSRSGHKFKLWFEGGQMPLTRRVPKFGFTPRGRVEMAVVNLGQIEKGVESKRLSGTNVTPDVLHAAGMLSNKKQKVKILGDGELKTKLQISAHAVSKSAKTKIEAVGGSVTLIEPVTRKAKA